jgi:eukaryotic-like serine/threonine-protein kinase
MKAPVRIGPYAVSDVLGSGGTGTVLRCVHETSGHVAAVKIPHPDAARGRESLVREIGVLTRLARVGVPGVVRVLDHGVDGDTPFYTMQLLRGPSLGEFTQALWSDAPSEPRLVAAGQLERVLSVVFRVAETLAHLHGEGVVHGDVAPGNVVLSEGTDPVLIDFGTGLLDVPDPPIGTDADALPRGTLGYAAPELALGTGPDPRADLYGLGCLLHELLTGVPAFSGERPQDVVRQQRSYRPSSVSSRVHGVPRALDELLGALLEPEPTKRAPRAEDVCRVVGELLPGRPRLAARELRPTLYRPRLHGRDALLQRLSSRMAGVASGGGVWFVTGQHGSGKTALLGELARRARAARTELLACRGTERERGTESPGVPGGGLELFYPLLSRMEAEFSAAPPGSERNARQADLEAVVPLSPRLASRTGLAGVSGLSDATVKRRAFDALEGALRRLAARAGLVVLIDELEGADELSLAFLAERARALAAARVLVVATCLPKTTALPESLRAVATAELELEPLSAPELRALAKDVLGVDLPPEGLVEFLERCSTGHPFHAVEALRTAASRRILERTDAGEWRFDGARAYAVPASEDELVELRLAALSGPARAVLGAIAVLEGDAGASDVELLTEGRFPAHDVLEELVAEEVLAPVAAGRYRFRSESLRRSADRALDAGERRRYHLRAAEQVERRAAGDVDAAALAHHLASAGEVSRALPHFEDAARAAERGLALERAAELYRVALEHAAGGHVSVRPRLVEARADILIKQAKHAGARDALRSLLVEGIVPDALSRARLRRKVAASLWTLHEYAPATEELDGAERELGAPTWQDEREAHYTELIQIRLGRCQRLYFAGSTGPELDGLVRELGALLAEHGTQDQRCAYAFTAASNALLRGGYSYDPAALALAEEGLVASEGLPLHRQALAHLLVGGALMLGSAEERQASLAHFEAAARKAAPDGEATLMGRIRIFHAMALLRTGDVDATEVAARTALDAAEAARLAPYVAAAKGCLGWAAWRRHDETRATALLEDALERWKSQPHPFPFRHFVLLPLVAAAELAEDFERAKTLLDELKRGPQRLPTPVLDATDAALDALAREAFREGSRAIRTVLAVAREHALV